MGQGFFRPVQAPQGDAAIDQRIDMGGVDRQHLGIGLGRLVQMPGPQGVGGTAQGIGDGVRRCRQHIDACLGRAGGEGGIAGCHLRPAFVDRPTS
jgi:hypothetical protein